jgi:hypothetical protein
VRALQADVLVFFGLTQAKVITGGRASRFIDCQSLAFDICK